MTNPDLFSKNFPKPVPIHRDEIHIWYTRLDVPETQVKKWQLYLSPDELQRAHRFHFIKDQHHFIVGRGVLRKLLGNYLNKHPYELRFEYNKYGKPFVDYEIEGDKLHFNLSHSHELCIYALTLKHHLGIDIEFVREDFSDLEIAERFFAPEEVKVLNSLPVTDQKKAFFLCWTRKEAFIKAKGKGLSIPLDQFNVSLVPGQPARLLKTRYDRLDVDRWSLFNIDLFPEYAAAVAVEGQNLQIKYQNSDEF